MTATPWIQTIQQIQDNLDYLRARDTNRPISQLASRTQYLFDALQSASLGELLVARNVPLDELTVPGTPVWFDTAVNRWKPARAVIDVQSNNDFGFAAAESEVSGLVLVKHTANTGDIALYGRIRNDVWGIDWDQVIDTGALASGRYYLGTTSGQITQTRNVLSVEIGVLNSTGDLVFTPAILGNLRAHLHLRFELEATIGASLSEPGWVAVANFGGAGIPYPVGAVYGYNLTQNPSLAAKFPPQPLDNFFLAYNGVGVHKDSVVVDQYGIWWMNASESPAAMGTHLYQTSETEKYFEFWMTLLNAGTKLVNTLQTSDSQSHLPISIKNLDGEDDDSGDLRIFLEQAMRVQNPPEDEGAYAIKNVSGVLGARGPVVCRIKAGPGISLLSSAGTTASGRHGLVTIALSAALMNSLKGVPALVALDNAREDFYAKELPVLNLPVGRRSGFKLKIQAPDFLVGENNTVVFRFGMISSVVVNSSLSISRMIVRQNEVFPAAATAEPAVVITLPANRLTVVETAPISGVRANDVILLDVRRTTPPASDLMFASLSYEIAEA